MSGRNFLFISIILTAIIAYGSLFPFQFYAHEGAGPLLTLIGTWNHRPGGGDFLSNIALYVPLGFFCCLAGRKRAWPVRLFMTVLCGFVLSLTVELTQYYDSGRDTDATDLYANTLGTVAGAILALFNPALVWGKSFQLKDAARVPLLLLATWVSYKLFPFVPDIDLHKYWHAVEPLLMAPQVSVMDLFRHFATWTLAAIAVRAITGRQAFLWYAALFGFVMVAKIFVLGGVLSLAEIAGGSLPVAVLLALGRFPRLLAIAGLACLTVYVVLARLMPFEWLASPRPFGWIPLLSLMQGSVIVDMLSFLEKFTLYGGLIWLLRECGMRLKPASIAVAALLFALSWVERYLPGRSAEITDALLALIIGVGFGLLESPRKAA